VRSVLDTDLNLGPKRPAEASIPLAVDIRYGQIGLMQLRIRTTDAGALLDELTGRMNTAPNFFQRTAVCIDLSDLETAPGTQEIKAILEAVRRAGMLAVGLASASAEIEALSNAVNLPILSAFRPANHSVAAADPVQRVATAPVAAEVGIAAMIQQQTVRSGQRIYARNRDLVITAGVGAGAEVIADGCVHIGFDCRYISGFRNDPHRPGRQTRSGVARRRGLAFRTCRRVTQVRRAHHSWYSAAKLTVRSAARSL
jgi:septum site-determining protein MinC